MAAVSGTSSVPWGQQKKQETPTTGSTPTTTEPAPTTTAPAPTTTAEPAPTTQIQPSGSTGTTQTAPASAPVPAATAYSPAPEAQKLPERLRDLIVELQTVSGEDTSLELFARELALARRRSEKTATEQDQTMLTAREIMASASASLVAQANHSRESARAILQSV